MFSHFLKVCVSLALFVQCASQSWSDALTAKATDPVEIVMGGGFENIGLSVTTSASLADQKVLLMVTANYYTTSNTDQIRFTIFRNGEMLFPVMHSIDATAAGEYYPVTFTFIDTPGTALSYTYSVVASGLGVVSHDNTPRSMFCHVFTGNYPATGAYASSPMTINSVTPTSLASSAYATESGVIGGHLVGATAVYYPLQNDQSKTGHFSLTRDDLDLSGGTGFMLPNSPVNKRRTSSILFFDTSDTGHILYRSTARLANAGDPNYSVGSEEFEARSITAVAMPPDMGFHHTSTATGNGFSSSTWASVGLTATVPGSKQASKVLVTVNTFVRHSADGIGRFTIFRDGVNLGDVVNGMQTVAFAGGNAGVHHREATFFFVDELVSSSAQVTYTVMFRVEPGSVGTMTVGQSGVKSQIAAIVLDGSSSSPASTPVSAPASAPVSSPVGAPASTPVSSPVSAPTSPMSAYDSFVTSPTYTTSPGFAFAARNPTTGAAWTWGQLSATSSTLNLATTMQASGTSALVGNRAAYAFLKSDGSLGAFGVGALIEGSSTFTSANPLKFGSIASNDGAFAGISTSGGKVLAFGSYYNGGDVSSDARCNGYATQLSSGVVSIVASSAAFAAVKSDGSVYAWGNKFAGGGVSTETRPDLVGVTKVFATSTAFAALLASGAVKAWGDAFGGGDSSAVASALSSGVMHIIASQSVFVAYKADTSIVVWGNSLFGGSVTSSVVPALTSGVKYVSFTAAAAAALKTDGSVVAWGTAKKGGDTSAVSGALTNIVKLYSNRFAFAALTAAGGVVAWGDEENGGLIPSNLASVLSSGVTDIFSTHRAFAALKGATGQLVLWGSAFHGGSAAIVTSYLNSGVRTVCANDAAFTAILQDGRAVAWGHPSSVPTPGLVEGAPSFAGVDSCATGAVLAQAQAQVA